MNHLPFCTLLRHLSLARGEGEVPEARVFFPSSSFIFPNNSLQKSALLLCPLCYSSLSLSQLFLLLIRSDRNNTQLSIPEPRRQEEVFFFLEIYMEELLSCYLYLISYIIKCINASCFDVYKTSKKNDSYHFLFIIY